MKKELQSGIVEFDLLVEQFENGEINFVELTSTLWNKGYEEGKKQACSQTLVSGRSEQLNCDHEWRFDKFDCYGFPTEKYCDKCGKIEAV